MKKYINDCPEILVMDTLHWFKREGGGGGGGDHALSFHKIFSLSLDFFNSSRSSIFV